MQARLKQKLEVHSGFGSESARTRKLVEFYKNFDNDSTGYLTRAEFHNAMAAMNFIGCSMEISALFDRYDAEGNGRLLYKDFCQKALGMLPDVEGNPILRGIMDRIRQKTLEQAGVSGIACLRASLAQLPVELNEREFRMAFRDFGVVLDDKEVAKPMAEYDPSGSGVVNVLRVVDGLRLNLNPLRKAIIEMAFDTVSRGKATVPLQDLCNVYRAEQHDAVVSGELTSDQVKSDLCLMGDPVDLQTFQAYYWDISSAIEDDDYFEYFLRSIWGVERDVNTEGDGLPGFKVLVTHMNGRQSEEFIAHDLNVSPYDDSGMKAALRRQGIQAAQVEYIR